MQNETQVDATQELVRQSEILSRYIKDLQHVSFDLACSTLVFLEAASNFIHGNLKFSYVGWLFLYQILEDEVNSTELQLELVVVGFGFGSDLEISKIYPMLPKMIKKMCYTYFSCNSS